MTKKKSTISKFLGMAVKSPGDSLLATPVTLILGSKWKAAKTIYTGRKDNNLWFNKTICWDILASWSMCIHLEALYPKFPNSSMVLHVFLF
jgi:hypothetical protein